MPAEKIPEGLGLPIETYVFIWQDEDIRDRCHPGMAKRDKIEDVELWLAFGKYLWNDGFVKSQYWKGKHMCNYSGSGFTVHG